MKLIPKRIKIPLADGGTYIIDSDKIHLLEFNIEPPTTKPNDEVEIIIRTVTHNSVIVETIKARRFHLDYHLYDAFMNYCIKKQLAYSKKTQGILRYTTCLLMLKKSSFYHHIPLKKHFHKTKKVLYFLKKIYAFCHVL
ncbi:hypothetical protein [Flectobacillus sp. BAB-3569]|uniref:hypothetical protein n=1 Tax=Flectobacillus sp. BAB-3569 TaxID=1509483 RepID=UPI000BA3BBB2|nr:hypothetical protein [Flectobacillus sp. BAB-3569]PAC27779.1 hypothetical protein BWI92_21440 [Flectobacillus sp. BAB-3569]